MVQHLFTFKWAPEIGGRVVYLDDYDLSSAARMVRGCDVWLNLPRPPLEASGTSGMKSAVNGGLQLSVLDGWWAEGYDGENGWALPGEEDDDHAAQDRRDGDRAAPAARARRSRASSTTATRDGLPRAWLARVRALAQDERAGVLRDAHGARLRRAVLRAPAARRCLRPPGGCPSPPGAGGYRDSWSSAPPQNGQLARSPTRSANQSRRQRRHRIRVMRTSFLRSAPRGVRRGDPVLRCTDSLVGSRADPLKP